MRKALPYLILVVAAIVVFLIKRSNNNKSYGEKYSKENTNRSADVNRNHGFDRRITYLEYTAHAKCRMDCRHITQQEVEAIMKNGKINYRKSDVNKTPCPVYALEGVTNDNQDVRIVFAQCDFKTKVVTVIDIHEEWQCDCPGDYKSKLKN